ncbi:MAG: GGDEF domain-containing protein [Planctomycetales bacterium]|nr:GGDEF domain-containing protein [Planctomycetales bacterium]
MLSTLVISGLLLGMVQLLVGVGIGLWVSARRPTRQPNNHDLEQAREVAEQLRDLTAGLSDAARKQGDKLREAGAILASQSLVLSRPAADLPLTELVTGVLREMIDANQRLQDKLTSTELELEEQSLELAEHLHLAMTDALTGLPNRRALEDHLRIRMDAWRKHKTPFSLIMLDVDHFKRFNDTYGHSAGDEVLRTIAGSLRDALRQHDVVTRYGGEEFSIVLPHTTLDSALAAVSKAIRAVRDTPVIVNNRPVPVTASLGVASLLASERVEDLLERADAALYAAKHNGRDRAWLHDGSQSQPIDETAPRMAELEPLANLDPDLEHVCNDLRSSLSEFLSSAEAESQVGN